MLYHSGLHRLTSLVLLCVRPVLLEANSQLSLYVMQTVLVCWKMTAYTMIGDQRNKMKEKKIRSRRRVAKFGSEGRKRAADKITLSYSKFCKYLWPSSKSTDIHFN